MIVPDLPRILVNYAHAQTVDTRPLFRGGVWPGGEASTESTVGSLSNFKDSCCHIPLLLFCFFCTHDIPMRHVALSIDSGPIIV